MPTIKTLAVLVGASALAVLALPALGFIVLGPRQLLTDADYLVGGRAQYEGQFGVYVGTPIAPRYFVTVRHIGNNGGGFFTYRNGTATNTVYHVTLADTQDDLAVWKLDDDQPSFTLWAPLYNGNSEIGLALTAVGRGTDRGAEVRNEANTLCGWYWGAVDNAATFGTNTVDDIQQIAPPDDPSHFGGDLLVFAFDNPQPGGGSPTECMASDGDSGGGIFVVDPADGVQKLAGLVTATDGGLSLHATSAPFDGAIFDARGLYFNGVKIVSSRPYPLKTYATRISSRQDFIRSIAGVPPLPCPADFNGDHIVNTVDLSILLRSFGHDVVPSSNGDVNEDGFVDTVDLALLLGQFGKSCP